jgi:hypothetical protein
VATSDVAAWAPAASRDREIIAVPKIAFIADSIRFEGRRYVTENRFCGLPVLAVDVEKYPPDFDRYKPVFMQTIFPYSQ